MGFISYDQVLKRHLLFQKPQIFQRKTVSDSKDSSTDPNVSKDSSTDSFKVTFKQKSDKLLEPWQ